MEDESRWSCLGEVTLHDLGFNKNFPGYCGEGIPAGRRGGAQSQQARLGITVLLVRDGMDVATVIMFPVDVRVEC